jgi:hypothetical protein
METISSAYLTVSPNYVRRTFMAPHPLSSAVVKKEYSYTSTPPMDCTACSEPQCLYKGALYLFF